MLSSVAIDIRQTFVYTSAMPHLCEGRRPDGTTCGRPATHLWKGRWACDDCHARPMAARVQSEQQRSIAQMTLSVAHGRMQRAYQAIPEVAIRVIEEYRDVMELDYAVKAWRQAKIEYERLERDQREAGLLDDRSRQLLQ